jgi:glycerol-3-phosphate dehydrogenase
MNIDKVTDIAYGYYNETKNTDIAWLNAEIDYSVNNEMTASITDFFIRRTSMIFFHINEIANVLNHSADFMAKMLNWTEEEKQKNIQEMNNEIENAKSFNK